MASFICATYIWLDSNQEARSKDKVIYNKDSVTLEDISPWNFDGSSTGQAPGDDSEVMIHPRAIYNDPFRGEPHVLVLCDCYTPQGKAIPTNTRHLAAQVFEKAENQIPWFGIEQEYVMFKDGHPLGWPSNGARHGQRGGPSVTLGYPGQQGPYYCSAGADVAFGREIVEEHMMVCTMAGLQISGINAEVMPGQWEFQVGPCVGINAADQHTMARYLLARVCEKHGVVISYEPKPIVGFNGSGCHTNFSTLHMRESDHALSKYIIPAIEKLGKRHAQHICNYGANNEQRLTGHHETASIDKFSYGVANRGACVRIGNETAKKKKGYFEDRRPAANMDPYLVTGMIFDTCVLDAKFASIWPTPAVEEGRRRGTGRNSFLVTAMGAVKGSVTKRVTQETRSLSRPKAIGDKESPDTSSVDANSEEGGHMEITAKTKIPKKVAARDSKKAGCAAIM